MLTLFGYSLAAVALIVIFGRNLSRKSRLVLILAALVLLNAPALLVTLFHSGE